MRVMPAIPDSPASNLGQNSETPTPKGVTAPKPVTTTRPEGADLRIDLIGTWKPLIGICRDLMEHVERTAPLDFSEVVAGTHGDNHGAQAFYEALGFK